MMLKKATVVSMFLSVILGSSSHAAALDEHGNYSLGDKVNHDTHANTSENAQAAHYYAVDIARSGQYEKSLEIFKQLTDFPNVAPSILFDYVTVMAWADHNAAAVELYETKIKKIGGQIPDYVEANVAGAYYQLKRYQEARQIYNRLAAKGNLKAKAWETECLVNLGEYQQAEENYNQLLQLMPDNTDLYVNRANMYLLRGDIVSAVRDIDAILELLESKGDEKLHAQALGIRADMAVKLMRANENGYAVVILKPAVDNGTATINMQCDYVLALFRNGDYAKAVKEGTRLWPDYRKVPLYGRIAMADSYLRLNQTPKAIPIYKSVLAEDPSRATDKQSLAYAYVLNGEFDKGRALYEELLELGVERANYITFDASAFFTKGRYKAGRTIYQMVIDKYPEQKVFRQRFASDLNSVGLLREANEQYRNLAKLPDGQVTAAIGIVDTAVAVGDYSLARSSSEFLKGLTEVNPSAGRAINKFDQRNMGEAEINFIATSDYKGNDVATTRLFDSHRLGDRFSVLTGFTHNNISDNDASTIINTYSVGGQYTDMQNTFLFWLDQNRHNGTVSSGYRFNASHYFSDQSRIDLSISRNPVQDVQALKDRIMNSEYHVALNRQIGEKDYLSIGIGKGFFSDSNKSDSYDFYWNHTMIDRAKRQVGWFTYYRRTNYEKQLINGNDPAYESPDARESYGFGLRNRLNFRNQYIEQTIALEWGRDRPEPIDFNPYMRFEYGYNVSQSRVIVFGTEYGMRTGRSTNTGNNLQFSYRQYDLSCRMYW